MAEAQSYTTTVSLSGGRREFRKLLCDISEKLDENELEKFKYINEITGENVRSGLDVLKALEKQGIFSPQNTEPLAELLQDINRKDLADDVRAYKCASYDELVGSRRPVSRASSLQSTSSTQRIVGLRRTQTLRPNVMTVTVSGETSPALSAASSEVNIVFRMPSSESMLSSAASGEPASNPLSPTSPVEAITPQLTFDKVRDTDKGLVMASGNVAAGNSERVGSPKIFTGLKHKLGWKGKRDDLTAESQKRISKCTWIIEYSKLSKYAPEHINCIEKVSVDIGCGENNPYLTFSIHSNGIFEDVGKSMTLQIRVAIPHNCPPIPTKATFDLSWEILTNEGDSYRKIRHSKKPTQVRFNTGMEYVHKFIPFSVLPKNVFKSLEISLCVSTAYSFSKTPDHMTDI